MSSEEASQNGAQAEELPRPPTEPAAMAAANKKRPRLDLSSATERRRGKSMFGILVGTLNKAKIEDKERNASEAAKKRQLIEQRLQLKLRKETDSVRRAEEAKKEKTTANRKEEELQLKDSVYKLRRTRLPILSNFLLTSDVILTNDSPSTPSTDPLAPVPRTHPPPLYYLPKLLTPAQKAFIAQKKAKVQEAVEKEWESFRDERKNGIEEIHNLRAHVAEEETRQKTEREIDKEEMDTDGPAPSAPADDKPSSEPAPVVPESVPSREEEMDVDDGSGRKRDETSEQEKKEDAAPIQPDDDDAVEY